MWMDSDLFRVTGSIVQGLIEMFGCWSDFSPEMFSMQYYYIDQPVLHNH